MIKCEVIENFTLEKHNELKNVKKVEARKDNEFGVRDTFECTKDMAEYLTGKNVLNKTVVKVIEVIPEEKKYSFVIAEKLDDEYVTPLNSEKLEKVSKEIIKSIKKKTKKKK